MGELTHPRPSRWQRIALACGVACHLLWIVVVLLLLCKPNWDRFLVRWIVQNNKFGRPEPAYFIAIGYELSFAIDCFVVGWGMIAIFILLRLKHARRLSRQASGRCWACGYDLRGLTANTCSECGTSLRKSVIPLSDGGDDAESTPASQKSDT